MQNDIAIRPAAPADSPSIARVHVETWHSTYVGIMPPAAIDAQTYERRLVMWTRLLGGAAHNESVLVADDPVDGVVGFAAAGPRREGPATYAAQLYALYVLAPHQRRGLGRRLVRALAGALVERRFSSMLVWVFQANPACHFYEALGGQPIDHLDVVLDGVALPEVAYGWHNLSVLA